MECELCKREMERLTAHHLIPRQTTKRKKVESSPTINICSACHRQVHAFFDNKYLAKHLNTLDKLKNDPKIRKFLNWISKQQSNKKVRVRR
ncbi:HNH endonuclease [Lusitaniella coriacea LEGE 07157]|uniref:HNH endonuclease n=2 Tax=Lusitaniella TaxID=1983104 RepID=A0A8J7E1S0_9CYAN|nr:HNH endonuclease [Lusitaniella coriacea LEGE 07157]